MTKTAGDAHFAAVNKRLLVELNHCLRRYAGVARHAPYSPGADVEACGGIATW